MKAYAGEQLDLHSLFKLGTARCENSTLRPRLFTPKEIKPRHLPNKGLGGPDALATIQISCAWQEMNRDLSVGQPVAKALYRLSYRAPL